MSSVTGDVSLQTVACPYFLYKPEKVAARKPCRQAATTHQSAVFHFE